MFDPSSVVVGLEIGTSKICAVAAEVGAEGTFRILGVGQAESAGVRKGEIVNPAELSRSLHKALLEVEENSDATIRSVWLGVTGGHIQMHHNRGFHPIASDDRQISSEDVQDALKIAKSLNLPSHNHPIHVIRQNFSVDGQVCENPVGMYGTRLEADVLVIHGNYLRLQSAIHAVKARNIEVEDVAFNGLGTQLAVLNAQHKELGALVIDIGAGTTEYVVNRGGIVRHAGVLAVGGDHVSQDLAVGLKLALGMADQLKIEHGSTAVEDVARGTTISIPNSNGLNPRVINLEHLRRIVHARLEEILEIVEQRVSQSIPLEDLHGGVVLCGGVAQTPGLLRLAERIFQLPARLGRIECVSGFVDDRGQVEFATAIGLAKLGSFRIQQQMTEGGRWNLRKTISGLFGRD